LPGADDAADGPPGIDAPQAPSLGLNKLVDVFGGVLEFLLGRLQHIELPLQIIHSQFVGRIASIGIFHAFVRERRKLGYDQFTLLCQVTLHLPEVRHATGLGDRLDGGTKTDERQSDQYQRPDHRITSPFTMRELTTRNVRHHKESSRAHDERR
jgi:hypothetical protein